MNVNPKILVTGANGQLGKELKDISNSFFRFDFIFLSRADLPIHHFELVRNYFNTLKPAYCINCAGYTAVDRAEEEKSMAFQVNGEAVGVLAAICKEHDTKLIHISTDYVFDGKATRPYTENFPPHPVNIYGASKLEGEKQALQQNPDLIIIRTSWLYSSHGKNFVKTMLRLMNEKNEIRVVNDQTGSPTYAADLAEVIVHIIDNWVPGIYHFSNDGVINWYEFANEIKKITGSTCIIKPISTAEYPDAAKRPAYSVLDKSKIQKTFNIKLKNWKTSLQSCIKKCKY
jgi:dTDP-4-dehydrorhamnose reductase